MGTESLKDIPVTLVLFTCERREHLLVKTYQSFTGQCDFKFPKVILAIDGQIDPAVIGQINPDMVVQQTTRLGYVNSISNTVRVIDTPYFFWLEDDWRFNKPVKLEYYVEFLINNKKWAEIILSKFGPLEPDLKVNPLENNFYKTTLGFSANPSICNTVYIQKAFALLATAPKGDKLGEDGFENFLSRTFEQEGLICVIEDPVDHTPISHEGYLESTPRNWHMTNSLETKTKSHLLTIPAPSFLRKLAMVIKLLIAFVSLSVRQLFSNKIYEFCFRIIASSKTIKSDE
jgi:hypothetical protein